MNEDYPFIKLFKKKHPRLIIERVRIKSKNTAEIKARTKDCPDEWTDKYNTRKRNEGQVRGIWYVNIKIPMTLMIKGFIR